MKTILEAVVFAAICGTCLFLLIRAGWHLKEIWRMTRRPKAPARVPLGWKCPWCLGDMVRDQQRAKDVCSRCEFTTAGRVHWIDPR